MGKCGRFFPGDSSLVSRGKSHSSRVRGLVVRCLLFNREVSCSNPCVCAFFTSIPKQKVLTFFDTMRLPLFCLCETFFQKLHQSVLPSICLIFCSRTNVRKSQRVPLSDFSTLRLFKFLIFLLFFFENFLKDSKRSLQFFEILQHNGC